MTKGGSKIMSKKELIDRLSDIEDEITDLVNPIPFYDYSKDEIFDINYKKIELRLEWEKHFNTLIGQGVSWKSRYFIFCSVDNFIKNLPEIKVKFYNQYPDANEIDVFNDSLEIFKYSAKDKLNVLLVNNLIREQTYKKVGFSQQRILEYLEKEIINYTNKTIPSNIVNEGVENDSKITNKHHALTYLFDLMVSGNQLPENDGGLAQSIIKDIGVKRTKNPKAGSGFVKAVREIKKIDLNSKKELLNVSRNWREIVLKLSENPKHLENYLNQKGL